MGQNQAMMDLMKEQCVELLKAAFSASSYGFKGNYSEKDLIALEGLINDLYPVGHKPMVTTYIPFGFYLGETIIRNIPEAKWDLSEAKEGELFSIRIKVEAGESLSILHPFARIANFWADREDGLAVFYRTVNLMSLNFIQPKKMEENKWMNLNNGDKIRFVKQNIKEKK